MNTAEFFFTVEPTKDFGIGNRVDSFVFYLVSRNKKLSKTGHCFAEFRSFRKTEKNTKIGKMCFELFRETGKQCFVSYFRIFSFQFCIFSSSFVPSIQVV